MIAAKYIESWSYIEKVRRGSTPAHIFCYWNSSRIFASGSEELKSASGGAVGLHFGSLPANESALV